MKKILVLLSLMLFSVCTLNYAKDVDSLLITNGTIYTASNSKNVEAIGVRQGKIISVGSKEQVEKDLQGKYKLIDLKGKFLMPGIIDSHVHVGFAGFQYATIAFPQGFKSSESIIKFAKENMDKKEAWIEDILLFMGTSLTYWDNIELLNKAFNSKEFENIPVILAGEDAHTGWCNNAMLKKIGITDKSLSQLPEIVAKNFGRYDNGSLNGYSAEGAWDMILSHTPKVSDEKVEQSILAGAKVMHSYGITAWLDPISNIKPLAPIFSASPTKADTGMLPVYASLLNSGKLKANVRGLVLLNLESDPKLVKDVLYLKNKYDNDKFKILGVKLLQDGVIEYPSRTAKISQDYVGMKGYNGAHIKDIDKYNKFIAEIDKAKLVAHTHVIGDRAAKEALDGIEYARKVNGNSGIAHSMTHLEVVDPKDYKRLKELNVIASMQLLWAGKDFATTDGLSKSIPSSLMQALYPAKSLINNGAVVAGASDWPVSTPNPFPAIYTAITRKGALGVLPPGTEKVSRDDILKAYTINSAKLIGMDNIIGSIEVGKQADFVLLDNNLMTVNEDKIPKTKVIWTMFKGDIVYKK